MSDEQTEAEVRPEDGPTASAAMSPLSRRRGLRATTVALVAFLALIAAAPAAAKPNPFLHDVDQINGHLRTAIEFAPEELGEALGTAEVVCGLGERAASGGEAEAAAADWSTLDQLVNGFATDAARRVEVAFAAADGGLQDLRERLRTPLAPATRASANCATAPTRPGSGSATCAARSPASRAPFAAWRAHECRVATEGVTKTFRRIPTGLRLINLGMLELWRLAGLLPSPTEGT